MGCMWSCVRITPSRPIEIRVLSLNTILKLMIFDDSVTLLVTLMIIPKHSLEWHSWPS